MADLEPGAVQAAVVRIGELAPDFSARSTQGPVSLDGYRGRWLVFFSHPADFTPVCTSEFLAFARAAHRFAALDCALLGHSVDSLFSHLAWLRALQDSFGVAIPFPLVEDPTLEIARAFGMVSAEAGDAASVRAVNWYPVTVGRSVEEILRLVAALKRTADGAVLTPEGWQPGDRLLAPPRFLADEALAGESASAWFYREIDEPRATGRGR